MIVLQKTAKPVSVFFFRERPGDHDLPSYLLPMQTYSAYSISTFSTAFSNDINQAYIALEVLKSQFQVLDL